MRLQLGAHVGEAEAVAHDEERARRAVAAEHRGDGGALVLLVANPGVVPNADGHADRQHAAAHAAPGGGSRRQIGFRRRRRRRKRLRIVDGVRRARGVGEADAADALAADDAMDVLHEATGERRRREDELDPRVLRPLLPLAQRGQRAAQRLAH